MTTYHPSFTVHWWECWFILATWLRTSDGSFWPLGCAPVLVHSGRLVMHQWWFILASRSCILVALWTIEKPRRLCQGLILRVLHNLVRQAIPLLILIQKPYSDTEALVHGCMTFNRPPWMTEKERKTAGAVVAIQVSVEMKSDPKEKGEKRGGGGVGAGHGEDYWIWQLIIHRTLSEIYMAETRDGPIWSFRLWLQFKHLADNTTNNNKQTTTTTTVRQIPNQILTGNKCYCPGLAAVPGLGNGSRCDTYGGGADNNNNILALNQRLLR
jgi:hypothetical protein